MQVWKYKRLVTELQALGCTVSPGTHILCPTDRLAKDVLYIAKFGDYNMTSLRTVDGDEIAAVLAAVMGLPDAELMSVVREIQEEARAVSEVFRPPSTDKVLSLITSFFSRKLLEVMVHGRVDSGYTHVSG